MHACIGYLGVALECYGGGLWHTWYAPGCAMPQCTLDDIGNALAVLLANPKTSLQSLRIMPYREMSLLLIMTYHGSSLSVIVSWSVITCDCPSLVSLLIMTQHGWTLLSCHDYRG